MRSHISSGVLCHAGSFTRRIWSNRCSIETQKYEVSTNKAISAELSLSFAVWWVKGSDSPIIFRDVSIDEYWYESNIPWWAWASSRSAAMRLALPRASCARAISSLEMPGVCRNTSKYRSTFSPYLTHPSQKSYPLITNRQGNTYCPACIIVRDVFSSKAALCKVFMDWTASRTVDSRLLPSMDLLDDSRRDIGESGSSSGRSC